MRRLFMTLTVLFVLSLGNAAARTGSVALGQQQGSAKPAASKSVEKTEQTKADKNQRVFTAEQVVESAILLYGGRGALTQIRHNGLERGRICKPTCEVPGKAEEATYEHRFVRGDNMEKDKIRLDQKTPTLEYSLIYGTGHLWGLINGSVFTPRQDAADTFLSQQRHSLDTLLRYKENGSTLNLIGRDKQKGLDLYVVDVVDKEKQSTRYYISAKSLHVLWLEYEAPAPGGSTPLKYLRKFHDYRYAQGTLVPFRIVLLEDGKQIQETRVLTVTYGLKIDDALFKSPEA